MTDSGSPAVFVDRDGVVNRLAADPVTSLPEGPVDPELAELLPGVAAALDALRGAGYLLVLVTNQPAAAKGTASVPELRAVEGRIEELLAREGVEFDRVEMCLHHPDGVVPELTGRCDCRKPAPGMLLRAASELGVDLARSWMIGDSDSDIEAGQLAGCRTILVINPESAHRRGGGPTSDAVANDLVGAVVQIVDNEPNC